MTNEEIHHEAVVRAKNYQKSELKLIDILQRVDEKRIWAIRNYPSLHVYLTAALKLSDDNAYKFARVSRKCAEVPELKTAIARGNLNLSTASRLSHVITSENSSEWIEKGTNLKQRELDKEIVAVNP